MSLQEFTKRAEAAESQLNALEAQLNALATAVSSKKSAVSTSAPTDDEKDEWKLFYWPGYKNRGNYIRLVLAEANIPYENITAIKQLKTQVRSDKLTGGQTYHEGGPFQAMALPVLRNGDMLLSQSIVCMAYLAEKFNLTPKAYTERARAGMIANNTNDVISEMYSHQKDDTTAWQTFIDGRLQIWFDLFEKPLKTGKLSFYFEDRCTFADLAVFNVLNGLEEIFGDAVWKKCVVEKHAYLAAYYNKIKLRQSVDRLMQKQKDLFFFPESAGWASAREIFRSM